MIKIITGDLFQRLLATRDCWARAAAVLSDGWALFVDLDEFLVAPPGSHPLFFFIVFLFSK